MPCTKHLLYHTHCGCLHINESPHIFRSCNIHTSNTIQFIPSLCTCCRRLAPPTSLPKADYADLITAYRALAKSDPNSDPQSTSAFTFFAETYHRLTATKISFSSPQARYVEAYRQLVSKAAVNNRIVLPTNPPDLDMMCLTLPAGTSVSERVKEYMHWVEMVHENAVAEIKARTETSRRILRELAAKSLLGSEEKDGKSEWEMDSDEEKEGKAEDWVKVERET